MPTRKKAKMEPLRERAEKLLAKKATTLSGAEVKDIKGLVHELQVHQIELEMQNEELRRAQAEIEESRSKYSDLYDFAPAGYFTLNTAGEIVEVNLTGAYLLNIERTRLSRRPFSAFVEPGHQWVFTEHFQKALKQGEETHCELMMLREGGDPFHAFLNSISSKDSSTIRVRTIVADITERKRAEEEARHLNEELKRRNIDLKESEDHLRLLSSQLINVQETERRRIATEIHDSLGQSLNAIKFRFQETIRQLEAAAEEGAAEEERHAAAKQLRNLIPVIQTAIEEARRIQMDLRPAVLDDLGIRATISWFLRQFRNTYPSIKVDEQILLGEKRLPMPLKTVIYRTLQEAMNNVAKHSGASKVRLELINSGSKLELTVQDNGKGVDLDKVLSLEGAGRGIGIPSMRERTEQLGGQFSIQSVKGEGTTVRMVWPM